MWKNVDKMWKMWKKNAYLIQKRNKIMHFFLEKSPQNICQLCSKVFSRSDSLKRHLSLCKLNNKQKMELKYPEVSKNVEKKNAFLKILNVNFVRMNIKVIVD